MMYQDTVTSAMIHGETTVGTTAAKLTTRVHEKLYKGVLIKADAANTGTVSVGGPGVTATGETTAGIPLSATEGLLIPVEDATRIWIIGSAANQKVFYLGN